ncbi:hypothetical protein QJS66_01265 [Kocuria rhizophila]|nr:hypothetical protein QJS66_01265 [Kocuria rhizophila]
MVVVNHGVTGADELATLKVDAQGGSSSRISHPCWCPESGACPAGGARSSSNHETRGSAEGKPRTSWGLALSAVPVPVSHTAAAPTL